MANERPPTAAVIALHQRHGYRPIDSFGAYAGNPSSVCYGKALTTAAHA